MKEPRRQPAPEHGDSTPLPGHDAAGPGAPESGRKKRGLGRRILVSLARIALLLLVLLAIIWLVIAQPSFRKSARSEVTVDAGALREHVRVLSVDCHPRSDLHPENLRKAAGYIERHFTAAGAETRRQQTRVDDQPYDNVIGVFGRGLGRKLVVGAHYDTVPMTPGADDNASAVAGLLEIARLLGLHPPGREIELVAYTLEEPPHFATPAMGSYVHAQGLAEANEEIAGVIVLEMIGRFEDERGSQRYPIPMLKLLYPSRGNFIAVAGILSQREFTKKLKIAMKGTTPLPVYSINAPRALPGMDFSDHRNYWAHEFDAVMVTDTAFYRNRDYHQPGDTLERLDYQRMAQVVVGVYEALGGL